MRKRKRKQDPPDDFEFVDGMHVSELPEGFFDESPISLEAAREGKHMTENQWAAVMDNRWVALTFIVGAGLAGWFVHGMVQS